MKKENSLWYGISFLILSIILIFSPIPGDEIIAGVIGAGFIIKNILGGK